MTVIAVPNALSWKHSNTAGIVCKENAQGQMELVSWPAALGAFPNQAQVDGWADEYALANAKTKKIAAVKDLLETKIAAGRLHNGKTYQIRGEDRENLLGVAGMFGLAELNPHGGTWRDLANTEVPLNDLEMRALLKSIFLYLRDLRRAATTIIVAIRAQATVAAVNALDINAGWPANT